VCLGYDPRVTPYVIGRSLGRGIKWRFARLPAASGSPAPSRGQRSGARHLRGSIKRLGRTHEGAGQFAVGVSPFRFGGSRVDACLFQRVAAGYLHTDLLEAGVVDRGDVQACRVGVRRDGGWRRPGHGISIPVSCAAMPRRPRPPRAARRRPNGGQGAGGHRAHRAAARADALQARRRARCRFSTDTPSPTTYAGSAPRTARSAPALRRSTPRRARRR